MIYNTMAVSADLLLCEMWMMTERNKNRTYDSVTGWSRQVEGMISLNK